MTKGLELRARYKPGENVALYAVGTDISAGHFVSCSGKTAKGAYKGAHTTAGAKAFGVAERDAIADVDDWRGGVNCARRGSIALVVAGAAVVQGASVQSDATGRAVTLAGGDEPVSASLNTGVIADNNAITWTAIEPGEGGNAITVALVFSDANVGATSVDVDGPDIVVTLESNDTGAGTILATAAEVIAAVEEHDTASQMVTVENRGASSGVGVVTAVAETPLAGGAEAGDGGVNLGTALTAADGAGDVIEVDLA